MKTFEGLETLANVMMEGYSKKDRKEIQVFASSFSSYFEIDTQRKIMEQEISNILERMRACTKKEQISTIIRHQSIPLKFFIFERFVVLYHAMQTVKIKGMTVEENKQCGDSFVDMLETTWNIFENDCKKSGISVNKQVERLINENS